MRASLFYLALRYVTVTTIPPGPATSGTGAAGRERTSPRLPLVKNTLSFYFTEQPEETVTDAGWGGGLNPPASPHSAGQVTLSEAELSLWGHS